MGTEMGTEMENSVGRMTPTNFRPSAYRSSVVLRGLRRRPPDRRC